MHFTLTHTLHTSQDFRVNLALAEACRADVKKLCSIVQLVTCRLKHPLSPSCSQDFRVNLALAEACRADVEKLCSKVQPGEGRVPKCLRDAAAQVSPGCKGELAKMEEAEASDVRLDAGLLQKCRDERAVFCSAVAPGDGRVFRCALLFVCVLRVLSLCVVGVAVCVGRGAMSAVLTGAVAR